MGLTSSVRETPRRQIGRRSIMSTPGSAGHEITNNTVSVNTPPSNSLYNENDDALATPKSTSRRGTVDIVAPRSETGQTPSPSHLLEVFRGADIGKGKSSVPTVPLREQERMMDELRKENFDLKLKCYHLEDQLRKQTPASQQALIVEHEACKATLETTQAELRALKAVVNSEKLYESGDSRNGNKDSIREENERLRNEVELLQTQLSRTQGQLRNLEQQLEMFERESREQTRRTRQLETEVGNERSRAADLQRALATLKAEGEVHSEALDNKSRLLGELQSEISVLRSECESLMKAKTALETKLHSQFDENPFKSASAHEGPNPVMVTQQLLVQKDSPRSSFDALEGRLLRQIGAAGKNLEVLVHSKTLSHTEKEALISEVTRLVREVSDARRGYDEVCKLVHRHTGLEVSLSNSSSIRECSDEVCRLVEAVLGEFAESSQHAKALEAELRESSKTLATLSHRASELESDKTRIEAKTSEFEAQLARERSEYSQLKEEHNKMTRTLRDTDLPRYREQVAALSNALRQKESEIERCEGLLRSSREEIESLQTSLRDAREDASRLSQVAEDARRSHAGVKKQQVDLLARLDAAEKLGADRAKTAEDALNRVAQAERVRSALEDSFAREMRGSHAANAELRAQFGALNEARSVNEERLERLQTALLNLEQERAQLVAKCNAAEAFNAKAAQDAEALDFEKRALIGDLAKARDTLTKSEAEIAKLKRERHLSKDSDAAYQILQQKVESLTSMNAILKGQVDAKERVLCEVEERMRRQDDAIRRAYSDCEAQQVRIKKREAIISRVLKRLESINAGTASALLHEGASKNEDPDDVRLFNTIGTSSTYSKKYDLQKNESASYTGEYSRP